MEEQIIQMPHLGRAVDQRTLLGWYKREGDIVKKDEALAVIETDKASFELSAPCAGILRRILVSPRAVAQAGATIGMIEPVDEALLPQPVAACYGRFHWRRIVLSLDRGLAILGGLFLIPGAILLSKHQPAAIFLVPCFALWGGYFSLHPLMARLRKRYLQPAPAEESHSHLESCIEMIYQEGWAGFYFSAAAYQYLFHPSMLSDGTPLGVQIALAIMVFSIAVMLLAGLIGLIIRERRR